MYRPSISLLLCRPLYHLFIVVVYTYAWYYVRHIVKFPFPPLGEKNRELPFKTRFLYLTLWYLVLHTVYFASALINDALGTNEALPKETPIVRSVKDILFSLAFPLSFYVSIAFWTMYGFYKDLIYPDQLEEVFPIWWNHVVHTFILPCMVLEIFITPKKYPTRLVGFAFSLVFVISYLAILGGSYMKSGTKDPVIGVMDWTMNISFILISVVSGISFYLLGEKLNNLIHYRSKSTVQDSIR